MPIEGVESNSHRVHLLHLNLQKLLQDEWNSNPYGGPGIQGYVFFGEGVTDLSPTAECYGRQLARTVILRLGAPDAGYASALGGYALGVGGPPEYYSPECKDGGAFDLNPGSSEWP